MKITMTIEKTTYTNLRENLAPHLRKILKNNIVLEIVWRNREPCVVMSKKHYDQLIKDNSLIGHVNVDNPLDGHGQVRTLSPKIAHGHKHIEKTPNSLISKPQHELF